MLQNAVRICDAKFGTLVRFDGSAFHYAAQVGVPPELAEFRDGAGHFNRCRALCSIAGCG